jgi:Uma2 family endonuclease
MATILLEDDIRIPTNINDVEAFRRWARSDEFPQRGRFAFLGNALWVDMSMEQAFPHNQVKAEIAGVLHALVKSTGVGYFFPDRMLLSHPEVSLSNEPDGTFVSYEAIHRGRVQLVEGAKEGITELVGAPDMVLEVVSRRSVHKDTVVLRQLYWEAGIREYWLVDARGEKVRFDVLRHQSRGYQASRKQAGWVKSEVFGRSFQLTRQEDALGNPLFQLEMRT